MKELILTILILLTYAAKPRFLFEENGRPRQFGVSFNRETMEKQTLFNFGAFVSLLSLLVSSSDFK